MALHYTIIKRSLSTSSVKYTVNNVTIIGGGLMGSGIAQVAAQAGNKVTLLEVKEEYLENSHKRIKDSLQRVAKKMFKEKPKDGEKFCIDTLARIKGTTDLKESVKDADLVVEAIMENMEAKHKIFKSLDEAAPEKTMFASNTSSFSIKEIGSVTKRLDRFGGLHFFSPVPVMKLLEVIKLPETSEETYNELLEWGKFIGKVCITCKDTPGFVVNRLLVPYMAEAVRLYERGEASLRDIDIAMKLGAGYPMGPFELADYTGLDIGHNAIEGWHKKFPDNPLFKPSETMKKLISEGKLGVKTGEGFYKYKK